MERKSRVQRYQALREKVSTNVDEPTVKSDDLYQYSQKIEKIPGAGDLGFSFEKENKQEEPVSSGGYIEQIKKENELISSLIKDNEKVINNPYEVPAKPTLSRASKYSGIVEELAANQPQPEPEVKPEVEVPTPSVMEGLQNPIPLEEPKKVSSVAVEQPNVFTEQDFDITEEEPMENQDINDSFLENAINEAKKYSIDKGQRSAIDTTSAIISELTEAPQDKSVDLTGEVVKKPAKSVVDVPDFGDLFNNREVSTDEKRVSDNDFDSEVDDLLSGDKPTTVAKETQVVEPVVEPKTVASANPVDSSEISNKAEDAIKDDNLDQNFFVDDGGSDLLVDQLLNDSEEETEVDQPSVVEKQPDPQPVAAKEASVDEVTLANSMATINDLTQKLDKEHVLRADLEQQTKQMKLEMGELGSEVTTVTKRMNRTNMVLNFVLVVLIIALFAILAFIAYWALVDRGLLANESITNVSSVNYMTVLVQGMML